MKAAHEEIIVSKMSKLFLGLKTTAERKKEGNIVENASISRNQAKNIHVNSQSILSFKPPQLHRNQDNR